MIFRILVLFFMFFSFQSLGQIERTKNYKRFDEKWLHFGFMLGFNSSDYAAYPVYDAYGKYQLKSLTTKSAPGGQVGIVTSLRLGSPTARLRLLPTLSFQERIVNYVFENPEEPIDPDNPEDILIERRVNSTNIDIPLMFQFRTTRLNNFATYALFGGQYTIDLQSQQDANQNILDPFLKMQKFDYSAQIGAGLEFFLPYFKLGLEVKYGHSFRNSLIQDLTKVSNPLDRTYNKTWWFSIIFEG
jgi:hypothetical protein